MSERQVPHQHDIYLEISTLSSVISNQEQQSDVSIHHLYVLTSKTPPQHESYHEIPAVHGFEFPLKEKSDIGSEIHSEITINIQCKEMHYSTMKTIQRDAQ